MLPRPDPSGGIARRVRAASASSLLRAKPHYSRVCATPNPPVRAKPHASRVHATLNPPVIARKTARQPGTRNAQPAPHCAQDRTARRAGATLSPFTTARKTTQPAGYAQCSTRLPLRKTAQPSGSRHAQPARHCAQNPTARWAGATLSPPPLRARPHASRAGTTLSP